MLPDAENPLARARVSPGARPATVVALIIAAAVAACAPGYVGDARRIAPERVTADEGWTVAPAPAVRQQRAADCGAAALAMVAARWQAALDIDVITERTPALPGGHKLGDLRDVARLAGLRAFAIKADRKTLAYELAAGRPVVVGLFRPYDDRRARSHYEVVVGLHADGRVATIDPADARWHVRSWEGLLAEWEPAGRPALVVLGMHNRGVRQRAP